MAKSRLDSDEAEIGRRVRVQRLARGVSQQQLAAQLGVSFQQVQKYEKGRNRVSAARLRQIAEALSVPLNYFLPENAKSEPTGVQFAAEFIDTARAVRLFRAFSSMNSSEQSAFVNLAEQVIEARK